MKQKKINTKSTPEALSFTLSTLGSRSLPCHPVELYSNILSHYMMTVSLRDCHARSFSGTTLPVVSCTAVHRELFFASSPRRSRRSRCLLSPHVNVARRRVVVNPPASVHRLANPRRGQACVRVCVCLRSAVGWGGVCIRPRRSLSCWSRP